MVNIGRFDLTTKQIVYDAGEHKNHGRYDLQLVSTRSEKTLIFCMAYCDKPYYAQANQFFAFDPYLQTWEELAQSPSYFKRPALFSIETLIYAVETFEEYYFDGKLIITKFNSDSLYLYD